MHQPPQTEYSSLGWDNQALGFSADICYFETDFFGRRLGLLEDKLEVSSARNNTSYGSCHRSVTIAFIVKYGNEGLACPFSATRNRPITRVLFLFWALMTLVVRATDVQFSPNFSVGVLWLRRLFRVKTEWESAVYVT